MTEAKPSPPTLFRRKLILPTEHGAWAWLLIPFGVGALVTPRLASPAPLAVASLGLTFLGALLVFFMRQPITVWLQVRRGRGRRIDGRAAAVWVVILLVGAGGSLAALILFERLVLLWLLLPLGVILVGYALAALRGRSMRRALWMELLGAVSLALMAPAAVLALTNRLLAPAWILWGVMSLQNILSVFYVRLRLADKRQRPIRREAVWGIHLLGLIVVLICGRLGWIPALLSLSFAAFWLRSLYAAARPRPLADVRRFGFTELGVQLFAGTWIVFSYWIW